MLDYPTLFWFIEWYQRDFPPSKKWFVSPVPVQISFVQLLPNSVQITPINHTSSRPSQVQSATNAGHILFSSIHPAKGCRRRQVIPVGMLLNPSRVVEPSCEPDMRLELSPFTHYAVSTSDSCSWRDKVSIPSLCACHAGGGHLRSFRLEEAQWQ